MNHKQVDRLMKQNNLFLTRHTGKPKSEKVHKGKVVTLHSNSRWCSDGFEIFCFKTFRSLQSIGIAEAFVNTFKRDFADINDRQHAKTMMGCLNDWFNSGNSMVRLFIVFELCLNAIKIKNNKYKNWL